MTWDEKFELAKAYYEHHGHLRIKGIFKTQNGYELDEDGFPLGRWIRTQRAKYKLGELTEIHCKKLESIGMIFENINDLDWNNFYELLKNYYEYHHNLQVPKGFKTINGYERDKTGKDLGSWLIVQRRYYQNGTLSKERKQKLDNLGNIFGNYAEIEWERMYLLASNYYKFYGNLEVIDDFKTQNGYDYDSKGSNISNWVKTQRGLYKKNKLSNDRIKKLENIGMIFENMNEFRWERMYNLAKIYYEHNGNLKVHRQFKTKNGYEYNEEGLNLGKWISGQYNLHYQGKLSDDRIKKLENIGMIFINQKEKYWNQMFELAKVYYEHHHDLNMQINFKTNNGYEGATDGKPLGKWVYRQRTQFSKGVLNKAHQQKLETIGFIFEDVHDVNWNKKYSLAKKYYEHHHNLQVPTNFKTQNGYTYDEKGISLGNWIKKQQECYNLKKIPRERVKKLENIGMVFESIHDINWEKIYTLAKNYYEHHHNLQVPKDFKTQNGYTYDESGTNLQDWISRQRANYKEGTLSKERIQKLGQIGMIFESIHDVNWDAMYELAKNYYMHHYDLKVKESFKTQNGYTYDETGERLGQWISSQRVNYKKGTLSEIRIKKLQLIGMVFEPIKNRKRNSEACKTYDIDYKTYKSQIDAIPHREFIAKVNYLNNNGIPFEIDNYLHPIFFMSSINMEVRYGITLEQMINDYNMFVEKAKQKVKTNEVG